MCASYAEKGAMSGDSWLDDTNILICIIDLVNIFI
jgi:hypothetical protein